LDKSTIYSKDIDKRYGAIIFAFPSVKAGSIIDYKYRSVMKIMADWTPGFPGRIARYVE